MEIAEPDRKHDQGRWYPYQRSPISLLPTDMISLSVRKGEKKMLDWRLGLRGEQRKRDNMGPVVIGSLGLG